MIEIKETKMGNTEEDRTDMGERTEGDKGIKGKRK